MSLFTEIECDCGIKFAVREGAWRGKCPKCGKEYKLGEKPAPKIKPFDPNDPYGHKEER